VIVVIAQILIKRLVRIGKMTISYTSVKCPKCEGKLDIRSYGNKETKNDTDTKSKKGYITQEGWIAYLRCVECDFREQIFVGTI